MLFNDVVAVYLDKLDELAPSTVRTYYWNLRMIQKFKPDLDCADLSEDVVRAFRRYLVEAGNKPATVAKALTVFRIFCKKMLADGLIESDPFKNIKIQRVYIRRGFLTVRELKSLYLKFDSNKNLLTFAEQECVRTFLFSCFTGLRYSDLKTLTFDEIFDWKIRKQTQKNGRGRVHSHSCAGALVATSKGRKFANASVSCRGEFYVQQTITACCEETWLFKVFALSLGSAYVCNDLHYFGNTIARHE